MKYPRMGSIILPKSTVIRYPITIKIQQMKIITTFRRLPLLHFRQYIRGMNRAKSIKAIGNIPRLSDIFTPLCEDINPFWKGFGGLNITFLRVCEGTEGGLGERSEPHTRLLYAPDRDEECEAI